MGQSEMKEKNPYFTFSAELVQSHDLYDSYISNCVTENGIKFIYHKSETFSLCMRKPTKCRNWLGYYSHTRVEAVEHIAQLVFENITSNRSHFTWLG